MSSNARDVILSDIRAANGYASRLAEAEQEWLLLPRDYRATTAAMRSDVLSLLEERLRDYDAHVIRIRPADAADHATAICSACGIHRLVAPPGFPAEFLPGDATVTADRNFSPAELDGFDAAITLASLAIAETGTIVLQAIPGQGRRAISLIPDVHLCLVRTTDVVATVPEAFERLAGNAHLPITFVSGPSATADIEMTRIKGVHGPRFLHVLLLEQDT